MSETSLTTERVLPDDRARRIRLTAIRSKAKTQPLVLRGVRKGALRTFQPADLNDLHVDERYQRLEIRETVNQLIAAIEAGGILPAIDVAVRKDGSLYIVDGQQRWWACWNAKHAIDAQLWHVDSLDAERTMFSVFNNTRRPGAGVRIRAWVGPGGDLIRWLHEDEASPIRGEVYFGMGGHRPYLSGTLVKALYTLFTGTAMYSARTEEALRVLDTAVRDLSPAQARKAAQFYANVLKHVFAGRRVRHVVAIAIAAAAAQRWERGQKPRSLTPGALSRLERTNWERYAPNDAVQWVATLTPLVLDRWKQE